MEGQMDYVTFPRKNCHVADFVQSEADQKRIISQMTLADVHYSVSIC